jgi:spore maturation protein CgeB
MIPNSKSYQKVFWYFDFDPIFERKMKLCLSMSDFFFSMSPKITEANKYLCKNSFFLPQAADHFLYRPINDTFEPKFEVSFIGGKKRGRIERLQPLKKFDLHIFGEHWENEKEFTVHKAVYADEFNKICASSKILLNITHYDDFETPERTLSQKVFMIMATKAFCLTEEIEGLDYFFNKDEIAAGIEPHNIEFWLKSTAAREKMAENGYRKVLTCHTYIHRMQEMIKILRS